ncbi:CgeB family protein [Vibrio harveyi]|uniref:CgeB family protein n=1 Tax=Vibrio harveyi TaxID=669 RepID=UPI001C9739C0|nr:glycosyltransferase [Vibrio harveyi]MBY6236451.1 glycosyltransferase [Vibrio harveyi]HDM8191466.1 glycosyltransferase family 1 protein [Vibrio harveyi]
MHTSKNSKMKVLIVGENSFEIYESAFSRAFKNQGHISHIFSWKEYFNKYDNESGVLNKIFRFCLRVQNKLLLGPVIDKVNRDLLSAAEKDDFDLVFIYRGTHVYKSTIRTLKERGLLVYGYNNDDPFSNAKVGRLWKHYLASINEYNHVFYYRMKNEAEYVNFGVKNISLLRSYYISDRNYLIDSDGKSKYKNDVVFIGHFENDGRDEIILELLKLGVDVKLYGTQWHRSPLFSEIVRLNGEIVPVYKEYNEVLNAAKIALVFLSKRNNDTYTRRVFEIPVTKTVMVSEYSDDLSMMFDENSEILLFKNKSEAITKIQNLLNDSVTLNKIADNAYNRVLKDGHEVNDRVKQIIDVYRKEKEMCLFHEGEN